MIMVFLATDICLWQRDLDPIKTFILVTWESKIIMQVNK